MKKTGTKLEKTYKDCLTIKDDYSKSMKDCCTIKKRSQTDLVSIVNVVFSVITVCYCKQVMSLPGAANARVPQNVFLVCDWCAD